jgi:plasmid stabilization system protein ParE
MRLELHPLAHSDISRIVDHYKRAGGADLADEFIRSCARSSIKLRILLKATPSENAISGG